jgi:hypothetical protein
MYELIRRAKWLGVPPWELLEKIEQGEEIWFNWAAVGETAEYEAFLMRKENGSDSD